MTDGLGDQSMRVPWKRGHERDEGRGERGVERGREERKPSATVVGSLLGSDGVRPAAT
jgi:hypothetical protein